MLSGRVEEAVWHVSDWMSGQRYARWGDSPGDLHIHWHGVGMPQTMSIPITDEESLKHNTPHHGHPERFILDVSRSTSDATKVEIDRSEFNFYLGLIQSLAEPAD